VEIYVKDQPYRKQYLNKNKNNNIGAQKCFVRGQIKICITLKGKIRN